MTDTTLATEQLAWDKMEKLIPAIVQDNNTRQVLMLGYMNPEALATTLQTKRVTFYSRSKQRLWTKGETSGHFLELVNIVTDCDQDCLLILANPIGPCCHFGTTSCFNVEDNTGILTKLAAVIADRDKLRPEGSYVTKLLNEGVKRAAQKVGEEGVEVALAATTNNSHEIINESADLLFHLLVLLQACRVPLSLVLAELTNREKRQRE